MPPHSAAGALISEYLVEAARHASEAGSALFRHLRSGRIKRSVAAITADAVYKIVRGYSAELGFQVGAHALHATAATNALV